MTFYWAPGTEELTEDEENDIILRFEVVVKHF